MHSMVSVAEPDSICICGYVFKREELVPMCPLEKDIPSGAYVCRVEGGKMFAVKCKIGKDPHPFLSFFEAAIYEDGAWVVGIDEQTNEYFTPVFTNGAYSS